MMAHVLIRLHGNEDWARWGDHWHRHVDEIGELSWVNGWIGPPDWLRERVGKQRLDWGAILYEVSKEDVQRLVWEPEWLADTDAARKQRALLESLSKEERYGVIFMEVY